MTKSTLLTFLISGTIHLLTAQVTFQKINDFAFQDQVAYLRGISWVDVDNDYDLDVCITGSSGHPQTPTNETAIFLNDGLGDFTKSSLLVSSQKTTFGHGWADIENDGDLDIYIAATWGFGGTSEFWLNDNGTGFTLVTNSGLTPGNANPFEGTVSWGDYDADGFVDLFLPRWNQQSNIVYRNNGNGTFSNADLGILTSDQGWTSGGIWGDYDNDQDLDLYVFNYQIGNNPGANDLFENNGNGTFTKNTTAGAIVTDAHNTRTANWVDANNDGWMDIYVANQNANNFLYLNQKDGTFSKNTIFGSETTWSSNWGDFDNDGDEDLFIIGFSGTESAIFENTGNGTMVNISSNYLNILPLPTSGSLSNGIMFVDYDNDGWLDLHITQPNTAEDYLFKNEGLDCVSYINIKCTGIASNWAAIGTTIRAKADINGTEVWQMRQVSAQTSKPGQNPMWVHFGFQYADNIDSLVFEWPSGEVCVFEDVAINQLIEVTEACEMLEVLPPTTITGETSDTTICVGDEPLHLTVPSGSNDGEWFATCGDCIDGTGVFSSDGLAPGNYQAYYGLSMGACGYRDTVLITIAPNPNLVISNDTTVLEGTELPLFVNGANNYLWEPTSNLSCDNCSEPTFTANEATTFLVTGFSEFGCIDTASVTISINEKPSFDMPNVFTPDNDTMNDHFNAVFEGEIFTNYSLSIYNRWGEKIFESTDPDLGWDGTKDNDPQPSDVYVYVFEYQLINGEAGKASGDLTLLR